MPSGDIRDPPAEVPHGAVVSLGHFAPRAAHGRSTVGATDSEREMGRDGDPVGGVVGTGEEGHLLGSPAAVMRARAMAQYFSSRSIPMNRNPSSCAALPVLPEPANGSSTTPPDGVIRRHR